MGQTGWSGLAPAACGYLPTMAVITPSANPRHALPSRRVRSRRVRPLWSSVLLLVLLAFVVPTGAAVLLGFGFSLVGLLLSW